MKLILLGPPGAGKGTQAVKIVEKYQIPHISTGDIFRKNIREGTELGEETKKYMDKGELVPDSLVVKIALSRLKEDDCNNGFLLDGFPRTVFQAEALDEFLKEQGKRIRRVLDIEIAEEKLIRRLTGRRICKSCGGTYHVDNMPPQKKGVCDLCGGELHQRIDDAEETVKHRIEVYHAQTEPLIEYYNKVGVLKKIDGSKDSEDVFQHIVSILSEWK